MQTILEVFHLRIMGKQVYYQRKQANLSRKGGDPDQMIRSLIQEKRKAASGKVEKREFIIHSTSWRYMQPGKVLLTYVAYSDELELEQGTAKSLPLKNLKTITKKSRKPRSRAELGKSWSHMPCGILPFCSEQAAWMILRVLSPPNRNLIS